MKGKLIIETIGSVVLKSNPLGDPRLREVPVYLPPSYFSDPERRYPVIYYLVGFTGTGRAAVEGHPWRENLAERLDRLIAQRRVPECLLVIPDCFTRYGGSQYVNSAGTGRYEDHIVDELVPYVDSKYRTRPGARSRAVMGKSSGGFGALWMGMRHPDIFAHVACHCGDMLFEISYGLDIPKCVNALARYGGSFRRFLREFIAARDKSDFPHELKNMAGMSSCYSPNARSPMGFDIPFDERTGEFIPAVWRRWQAYDPIRTASVYARNLKRLRTLYMDCGGKDEFYLHLGARKLSRTLKGLGVRHVYEEHDRGHFNMSARYDISLRLLGSRMSK